MSATLVALPNPGLRDIPAVLRTIADDVEAGKFGPAISCVCIIEADRIVTTYCGDGEAGPSACLLMQIANVKLASEVLAIKEG